MGPKDDSVLRVLDRLRSDLGDDAFDVVDHWDADLCAVGVARPSDHRFLVYISTFPPENGVLAYECERPSSDPDLPYDSDGIVNEASYDDVAAAVTRHLHG